MTRHRWTRLTALNRTCYFLRITKTFLPTSIILLHRDLISLERYEGKAKSMIQGACVPYSTKHVGGFILCLKGSQHRKNTENLYADVHFRAF